MKYSKIYCAECGKWIGVKRDGAITEGIYPYCPRCKKQVEISDAQNAQNRKRVYSAMCQH